MPIFYKSLKPILDSLINISEALYDQNNFKKIGKNYLGVFGLVNNINNIKKSFAAFLASPFYGQRIAGDVIFIIDTDPLRKVIGLPKIGPDLYISDSHGFMLNHDQDIDAIDRIHLANSKNLSSICFMGGSTVMGWGARLPLFSIPALVQSIAELEFHKKIECINCGVAAFSSQESLNLLVTEIIELKPELVIFYDGWNCCHQFMLEQASILSRTYPEGSRYFVGMSMRHLSYASFLKKQYEFLSLIKHCIKLAGIHFFSLLSSAAPFLWLKTFFDGLNTKFCSLAPDYYSLIINNLSKIDQNILVSNMATRYWQIHDAAQAICQHNGIQYMTFFQPHLLWGNKKMTDNEKLYKERDQSLELIYKAFYNKIKSAKAPDYFYDLGSAFDEIEEEMYIDAGHLNPKANILISQYITQKINFLLK